MFETATAPPRRAVTCSGRPRRRAIRLCGGLAMLAVLLALSAPVAAATRRGHARAMGSCPNADVRVGHAAAALLRAAVLCLVNRQRSGHHLPALHELRRLDGSAQGWTNSIVSTGNFAHTGSGSDPGARISATGYSWSSVGENIATGLQTPGAVLSAWMHSIGHCRNILDPDFSDIGIGVSPRPLSGSAYEPGTWTEDFALPIGEEAPSRNWAAANGCPY